MSEHESFTDEEVLLERANLHELFAMQKSLMDGINKRRRLLTKVRKKIRAVASKLSGSKD